MKLHGVDLELQSSAVTSRKDIDLFCWHRDKKSGVLKCSRFPSFKSPKLTTIS